jgi:hypothetical protein
MTALRLTTDKAAEVLGICPRHVRAMATRRGWVADGDTWSAADIHAAVRERAKQAGGQWTATDGFTKAGAERLAEKIRAYWSKRGRPVKVWVEPCSEYLSSLRTGSWYVVRSNLRNGKPPR